MFLWESSTNVGPKSWGEMQDIRQNNTENGGQAVGSSNLRVGWDSVTYLLCELMVK